MGSKPPAAPASAVSTNDLKGAWSGALNSISAAGNNSIPSDVWNTYGSDLMSPTPYGYDPAHTVQQGNYWSDQAPAMFAAGNQILNQGMDPQNDLYNRTLNQTQQQTRAGLEARGIDSSPYGASVEGGVNKDFNIDWQNAQLQRLMQAIQGGATAFGAGGNAIQGGQQLAGGVPLNVANYAGSLQQLGMNTTVPDQWQAGAYSNLFGTGANAQNANYQSNLANWKAQQDQSNSMWGGIGKLGGTLLTAPMTGGGSLFGNLF